MFQTRPCGVDTNLSLGMHKSATADNHRVQYPLRECSVLPPDGDAFLTRWRHTGGGGGGTHGGGDAVGEDPHPAGGEHALGLRLGQHDGGVLREAVEDHDARTCRGRHGGREGFVSWRQIVNRKPAGVSASWPLGCAEEWWRTAACFTRQQRGVLSEWRRCGLKGKPAAAEETEIVDLPDGDALLNRATSESLNNPTRNKHVAPLVQNGTQCKVKLAEGEGGNMCQRFL